ncbi:MAG: hypothetical protein QW498_07315 [Thermofilum sp.]
MAESKKLGKAALALLAALLFSAVSVLACFSQADLYAVEVVLNKPNVTYDLSKLRVEQVEPGVYAYRSPVDSRLLVALSELELPPWSGKFLGVRVQVPLRTVLQQAYSCGVELATVTVLGPLEVELDAGEGEVSLDLGELYLKGPAVLLFEPALEVSAQKPLKLSASGVLELQGDRASYLVTTPCFAAYGGDCVRVAMVIPGFDEPMSAEPGAYRVKAVVSWVSSEKVSGKFLVRVKGVILDQAAAGWKTEERAFFGATISKAVDGLEVKVSFTRRSLTARVEGEGSLSRALEEVEKLVKALGLPCALEPSGTEEVKVVPAYDVSRDEMVAALKAELEWLSSTGVISGLSSGDVEAIAEAAQVGFAGWNSRLVWSDGWKPYSSVEGALLVRCVKAPPQLMSFEAFERIPYRAEEVEAPQLDSLLAYAGAAALAAALLLAVIFFLRRR